MIEEMQLQEDIKTVSEETFDMFDRELQDNQRRNNNLNGFPGQEKMTLKASNYSNNYKTFNHDEYNYQ